MSDNWFKKHVDASIIISSIVISMLWMNGKFNEVDKKFSCLEKDIAVIKTVLVMKQIMPQELVKYEEEGKK